MLDPTSSLWSLIFLSEYCFSLFSISLYLPIRRHWWIVASGNVHTFIRSFLSISVFIRSKASSLLPPYLLISYLIFSQRSINHIILSVSSSIMIDASILNSNLHLHFSPFLSLFLCLLLTYFLNRFFHHFKDSTIVAPPQLDAAAQAKQEEEIRKRREQMEAEYRRKAKKCAKCGEPLSG